MFRFLMKSTEPEIDVRLYNTATGKKESFKPVKANRVTMYSCGPTVYDHIHIGNLRAYLLPDLITRLFSHLGFRVETTVNFTDFGHLSDDADAGEDKMVKGMQRDGYDVTLENMRIFAEPYIESFKSDNLAFGNLPPTQYTRASDYVEEQIAIIKSLEEKGYTYSTSDGVYFDISKYPEYGVLGNINLKKLKSGARVEVNLEKRNPADFALWKKSNLGWKSRWGEGFPGWHIECTAMAFATLGKQIDIHTGGEDLKYTHHNGEIAQAECVTGKKYVNYWLHNAHVTIDNTKIAKSIGNGLRLRHLSDRDYSPADYRFWLLQSHYRTTANFSWQAIESAKQGLLRLRRLTYENLGDVKPGEVNSSYKERLLSALSDDLDTPKALALLSELSKDNKVAPESKLATIHLFDSLLALGLGKDAKEGREELGIVNSTKLPENVSKLVEEREEARENKNFELSDDLRDQIKAAGYEVTDTPDGQKVTEIAH